MQFVEISATDADNMATTARNQARLEGTFIPMAKKFGGKIDDSVETVWSLRIAFKDAGAMADFVNAVRRKANEKTPFLRKKKLPGMSISTSAL